MQELFEQQKRMMEKTSEFWQEVLSGAPWLKQTAAPFREMCNRCIAGMRSAGDLNLNAWKSMIESSEEAFFKMLKESKIYSQAAEDRLRENWRNLKLAQSAQRDAMEEFLNKMEKALLKPDKPV